MSKQEEIMDKQKILDCVRKNPGRNTSEIAGLTGLETSDANGGHQNWYAARLLDELAGDGEIVDKRKNKGPHKWHLS